MISMSKAPLAPAGWEDVTGWRRKGPTGGEAVADQ